MQTILKNLSKSFLNSNGTEGVTVLGNISFACEDAGAVAILGPNGVGKTTLLKILAGSILQDKGNVSLDGQLLSSKRVRYVSQTYPILPWRKVIDDISLGLEIEGYKKKQRYSFVEKLFAQIRISLPLHQNSDTLSGGQKQLLNICRALVGPKQPDMLLLDEPFSALDVSSRIQLLGYLDIIVKNFKTQIVFTTHDLELAILAADLIVPFKEKPVVVQQKDTIRVPFERPREHRILSDPKFHKIHERITELLFSSCWEN